MIFCVTELDELVIIWWNNTEMEWHLKLSQAKYYFAQNATLHKMQLCTKCNFTQTRNVESDLLFSVYMCITKPFSTKSKF